MREIVFKKEYKKVAEKYLYFSATLAEMYYSKNKVLIKNYILEPDVKLIVNGEMWKKGGGKIAFGVFKIASVVTFYKSR